MNQLIQSLNHLPEDVRGGIIGIGGTILGFALERMWQLCRGIRIEVSDFHAICEKQSMYGNPIESPPEEASLGVAIDFTLLAFNRRDLTEAISDIRLAFYGKGFCKSPLFELPTWETELNFPSREYVRTKLKSRLPQEKLECLRDVTRVDLILKKTTRLRASSYRVAGAKDLPQWSTTFRPN